MRIRRGPLMWGTFLIVLGAIPLAARAGALDPAAITGWWNLWPLLLIGVGIGLVLRRTPLEVLGGLLVAAALGLMGGAFLATGAGDLPNAVCGNDAGSDAVASEDGSFGGPATIEVQLDCGELEVEALPGSSWSFDARGDADRPPTIDGEGNSLEIESGDGRGGLGVISRREHWQLGIPRDVPVTLDLQVNAGRAMIAPGAATLGDVEVQVNFGTVVVDLASATAIGELDVQSNAGTSFLTLPNRSLTGRIQSNAGSVNVCVPPGAGVRITTGNSVAGSYDLDAAGLVQDGSTWSTPGYDTADVRIELSAEANAGSFSLNPEEGCGG